LTIVQYRYVLLFVSSPISTHNLAVLAEYTHSTATMDEAGALDEDHKASTAGDPSYSASEETVPASPLAAAFSPTFKAQIRPEILPKNDHDSEPTSFSGSACLGVKAQLMSKEGPDSSNSDQLGTSFGARGKHAPEKVEVATENSDARGSLSSVPVEMEPPPRPGAFRVPGFPRRSMTRGYAHRLENNEAPVVTAPSPERLIIDAVLVAEGMDNPRTPKSVPSIQVATAADPVEFASKDFRRRAIFILIVAVVIVAASTVGALVSNSHEELPAMYRNVTIKEFREVLLPASSLEQETLDPLSPQGRALQWLEGDVLSKRMLGWRMLQRFSLAVVYFSLNGEHWLDQFGWISIRDECSWFPRIEFLLDGEPCDSSGQFIFLGLPSNNLSGSIPRELTLLSKLEVINLRDNSVSGYIPDGIGSLANVHSLYLGGNRMKGSIPSEMGFMSKLTRIIVENNRLSGTLPSEIGMLYELSLLRVNNNTLSGSLPTEFGLLGKLETLAADSNSLTGSIPSEVGGMISLKTFELSRNKLTGTIPTEFGILPRIELISIASNDGIRGTIPPQVCLLSSSS
jgi:hypothetical protein